MSNVDLVKRLACFVGSALKPDIPNLWPWKSKAGDEAPKIGKTTYLDGVRGISALIVYLTHHAMYAHQDFALHRAFGWRGEYHVVAFPGIRLFWSGGTLATGLFFIISGYVCSLGPLKLLHRGDIEKMAAGLGTGLPRRFVRLYYPALCITFLVVTSWHLFGIVSSNNATALPEANYILELRKWLNNFFRMTYLWEVPETIEEATGALAPGGIPYDHIHPHLWYIPIQFRGMVLINAVLWSTLAFHQWGSTARIWALMAVIAYFIFAVDGWYNALSIMGMLAADIDLLADKEELPDWLRRLKPLTLGGWIWYILFLFGVYFGGCPRGVADVNQIADNDPGWWFINWLTPSVAKQIEWYWIFWASTFVIISVPRIPWLRRLFEMSVPLYLGKICFGLYLVHGPILWTLGARVYAVVGRVNSRAEKDVPGWLINSFQPPGWGPLGLEVNYIAAQMVLLPISLWVAGVAHKLLDEPSGKIGNWLFDPKRRFSQQQAEAPLIVLDHRAGPG